MLLETLFHQTFSWLDIPQVFILMLLECALSADNAFILAALVKPLDQSRRKKALWIGILSAFILRLFAIFSLAYLIRFFWIQILGAAYLLYLAARYLLRKHPRYPTKNSPEALWRVIVRIEITDLIFAVDSIIAALGVIGTGISKEGTLPPKIWIVYVGGVMGLVVMRFAATILATLMDYFAHLEKASHYLIGWVAIKLGFQAIYSTTTHPTHPQLLLYAEGIFWAFSILILLYGFMPKRKNH